jgi:ADP-dependent NAD(P)H-hydrate dehydratase / NAD(P)H-hydrate epimerase
MRVLTATEMRNLDRHAVEVLGVPGMVLMENAAIGVADALGERFPSFSRVAIFCGPGNNGGDGLAVARHLLTRGYDVAVFAFGDSTAAGTGTDGGDPSASKAQGVTTDALAQRRICEQLGLALTQVEDQTSLAAALTQARDAEVAVDALFGTGLSRPLDGLYAEAVRGINALPMPRVAVDLPSGLDASVAEVPGPAVRANLTVTFAAPKIAHVLLPASAYVGELAVTDLGIPAGSMLHDGPGVEMLERDEVAGLLLPRDAAAHKGSFGHLLVVAGGAGKAGAAVLCARAAVRTGTGLVTVATPVEVLAQVAAGSIESMTLPLPSGPEGLEDASVTAALAAAKGKSALAIGPGLGTAVGTVASIRALVNRCDLPLVLDADGFNAFAGRPGKLRVRGAPTVLTPHPGEAARLLDVTVAEIEADRLASVRRLAAETGCLVILKGHPTLIATVAGDVSIVPTGNVVLASGGTGDVLTGILGSLLAQGYEPLAACQLGVYLHGLASDLWVAANGARGFAAADLIASLPAAFTALARELPEPRPRERRLG